MATQNQIDQFLKMITPIAQKQAKKHGNKIYPSVCVAQAAHESGFGTSAKMRKANALFGVKVGKAAYKFGTAWHGQGYKTGTTEYYDGKNPTKIVDYFRAYDTVEDSVEDYMDLLCTAKRYSGALNQPSARKCIEGIIKGGYATGINYVDHIMALIDKYNLTRIDDGVTQYEPVKKLPVLKYGSKGDAVKEAQRLLNEHGYDLKVDGIYGKATETAVLKFQLKNNIKVDGIIGKDTWNCLKSPSK